MQLAARPYITAGTAIVGAALVSVTPMALQLPDLQERAVHLTAAAAGDTINLGLAIINENPFSVGLFPLGPMADMLGLGHLTLAQIVGFLGMGDDQLSTLLPGLVDGLGLGKATLGTLVGDLGLTDTHLAPLLNGLVSGLGLDGVTIGHLADGLGLGGVQVGTLATDLVNGLGLGGVSVDNLVDGLGLGDEKLSALAPILTALGSAVPGLNDVTFGDVVSGLGLSGVQIGRVLGDLGASDAFLTKFLDFIGVTNLTTVGGLLKLAGLSDESVFHGLATLLSDPNAGIGNVDVSSALDALGFGHATLDQLLGTLPLTMSTDQLLSGLGLDNTTLGDLLGAGLIPSGATIGGLLGSLGLDDTSLDSLLGGLNSTGVLNDSLDGLLSGTGAGSATVDDLLNGLGLFDHALVTF
ncbi:hypothetical protein KIH27_20065 [Mycobacterium sp. M1]|uniref:PE-PGRS family protein n=1 Tax=Mycolicibacter acidiphilus TaxID=2835306 RepID=A0ABS5RQM7_9MYCO|nr:hypothetical protein [Mycolicibacter acidiphilus]MBS9535884.1 hypothetical protein [Mycolicibacter acidiphilus]